MADPGWYPDPGGADLYRYWDGSTWTSATSMTPGPPTASSTADGRGGPGAGATLTILVALLAVGLLVWLVFRPAGRGRVVEDATSSSPTASASGESSRPTGEPSGRASGGGPMAACPSGQMRPAIDQPRNGRYAGGGLSFAEVPGWVSSAGWGVDWATDLAGQSDNVTSNWVSIVVVGRIEQAVFKDPRTAAHMLMDCQASSGYYAGFESREDLLSQSVTIDGHPGWELMADIYVQHDAAGVPGDTVDIVVVDTGRPGSLSIFTSEVIIGDPDRAPLVDAARASLQVER